MSPTSYQTAPSRDKLLELRSVCDGNTILCSPNCPVPYHFNNLRKLLQHKFLKSLRFLAISLLSEGFIEINKIEDKNMIAKPANKNKMTIEIDTTEMNSAQMRMLKTLNLILAHVLVTENEGEFFDNSAEAMRVCASLLKKANFTEDMISNSIPYGDQVLEYSIDILQEHMAQSKVVNYDN